MKWKHKLSPVELDEEYVRKLEARKARRKELARIKKCSETQPKHCTLCGKPKDKGETLLPYQGTLCCDYCYVGLMNGGTFAQVEKWTPRVQARRDKADAESKAATQKSLQSKLDALREQRQYLATQIESMDAHIAALVNILEPEKGLKKSCT